MDRFDCMKREYDEIKNDSNELETYIVRFGLIRRFYRCILYNRFIIHKD